MANGCGTCQQPLHSCLGDRCHEQEEKSALLGLWVLKPLLSVDLPTWKGEPGPVHLRAGLNPWFVSLDLILVLLSTGPVSVSCWRPTDCLACLGSLVLKPEGVGTPSSTHWLTVSRAWVQSSGFLPYFTQEASSLPPHRASHVH